MRTQRIGLVAAASFLVATTGCAGSEANDLGQPAGPTPAQTRELLTTPSTALGDTPRELLIRDAERTYLTNSYSGVSVDGAALVIHRVPVPRVDELDTGLRLRHPDVPLAFVDAQHPRTVLNEVSDSIKKDIPYWQTEGVAVAAVAPRVDGSGVLVMVDQTIAGLTAAMRERYEFPNLELAQGEIVPA
ncbi:hypothetical protein [Salinispora fenicalii]|uniref:hypothetical protein n=1 Tax=Salinispora fenicalii TaxID=1137263 RepID=UPI000483004E|nr:hypothetical protein [Salinispora fenicalii]